MLCSQIAREELNIQRHREVFAFYASLLRLVCPPSFGPELKRARKEVLGRITSVVEDAERSTATLLSKMKSDMQRVTEEAAEQLEYAEREVCRSLRSYPSRFFKPAYPSWQAYGLQERAAKLEKRNSELEVQLTESSRKAAAEVRVD